MSFGTYARKVRDHSLPYGRRVNALAGCVKRYQPIGYAATFGYLEHVAGSFRRDDTALDQALGALMSSRHLWLAELGVYAGRRREAKRRGQRHPQEIKLNPNSPVCWYGDSRSAALFTVGFLLQHRSRVAKADADVVRLASICLDVGGNLSLREHEQLSELRRDFRRLREVSGWPDVDWPNWQKANQSLWLLHQIACAAASGHAFSGVSTQ